ARAPGVGAKRGPCRLRGDVHRALGGRGGARGRDDRHGAGRGPGAGARDLARPRSGQVADEARRGVRRVRPPAARVIVRWGLDSLGSVLEEVGSGSPLVVASERWTSLELPVEPVGRWTEVPSDRIDDAVAEAADADGVLAVGGGSAIDLGKAISAATELPLVSVPTTYAGAEWTPYFGVRDPDRRMRGGGGGAHPVAIVYEPTLTLELSEETTVGTAMNALTHCAEALYVQGHNPAADEHALTGARLISDWLPRVASAPRDLEARTELLRGASHGGAALAGSMLAL